MPRRGGRGIPWMVPCPTQPPPPFPPPPCSIAPGSPDLWGTQEAITTTAPPHPWAGPALLVQKGRGLGVETTPSLWGKGAWLPQLVPPHLLGLAHSGPVPPPSAPSAPPHYRQCTQASGPPPTSLQCLGRSQASGTVPPPPQKAGKGPKCPGLPSLPPLGSPAGMGRGDSAPVGCFRQRTERPDGGREAFGCFRIYSGRGRWRRSSVLPAAVSGKRRRSLRVFPRWGGAGESRRVIPEPPPETPEAERGNTDPNLSGKSRRRVGGVSGVSGAAAEMAEGRRWRPCWEPLGAEEARV